MHGLPQIILLTVLLASESGESFVIYKEGDERLQKGAMGVKPFYRQDYNETFNGYFSLDYRWEVRKDEEGTISAHRIYKKEDSKYRIPFAKPFKNPIGFSYYTPIVERVSDGYLISFTAGEFGSALYWYSLDGKSSYSLETGGIQYFRTEGDKVFAVSGEYFTDSDGGLYVIEKVGEKWKCRKIADVPTAGYTMCRQSEDSYYVLATSGVYSVQEDGQSELVYGYRGYYDRNRCRWSLWRPNSLEFCDIRVGNHKRVFLIGFEAGVISTGETIFFDEEFLLPKGPLSLVDTNGNEIELELSHLGYGRQ